MANTLQIKRGVYADLPSLAVGELGLSTDTDQVFIGNSGNHQIAMAVANNITYVPIAGDINAYITAATAGDTLVLAAGTYTITENILVTKALNIVGQGAGQTTINCATNNLYVFYITASNVRIASLSITSSGAGAVGDYGIRVSGVGGDILTGCAIENVNITMNGVSTSTQAAIWFEDTDGIVRDVKINSTNAVNGYGIVGRAAGTCEADIKIECFNTNVTVSSTATTSGIFSYDHGSSFDVSMYFYNCSCVVSGGSTSNYGAKAVGGDAFLYAENCVINGSTYDLRNETAGIVQVKNCVLVNNLTSGTITYAGVNTVGGIKMLSGSDIRPSTDSTTAINISQADGTDFVIFDTTNKNVRIGGSGGPSAAGSRRTLHIEGGDGAAIRLMDAASYSGLIRYDDTNGLNIANTGARPISFSPNSTEAVRILYTGEVGLGTTVPLRRLDINEATGNCLRLIYNDANGSPAYYADFLVSASGDLTITASGGDISFGDENIGTTGAVKGVHKAADGTAAKADGTYTVGLGGTTNGTITIKDGVITALQEAVA